MQQQQQQSSNGALAMLLTVGLGSAGAGLVLLLSFTVSKMAIRSVLNLLKRISRHVCSLLALPLRWNWRRSAPAAAAAAVVTKPARKSTAKVSRTGKQASKIVPAKAAEVEQPIKQVDQRAASTSSAPQVSIKKLIANAKSRASSAAAPTKTARHRLDLNTLKGHTDAIHGIAFSPSGTGLVTACGDMVVRLFQLDDATSKSYHILRLTVPVGCVPCGVAFGGRDDQIVVTTRDMSGSGLFMFGPAGEGAVAREEGKLPRLGIQAERRQIHGKKSVLTCESTVTSGDRNALVATCSEGTDIKLWSSRSWDCIDTVDTNQLQNTMATMSRDGRFLTAAAFTADVKIWEVIYGNDGQAREVVKVMLLKGHKSAVTWACFTWDSQRVITASKDGTLRVWNINVRYHLDEDPKCLNVFSIEGQFDRMAVSPDDKILAASQGSTLKWLSVQTGEVLDTAPNAHESAITCLCWAPQRLTVADKGKAPVLASASSDKKLKLWASP